MNPQLALCKRKEGKMGTRAGVGVSNLKNPAAAARAAAAAAASALDGSPPDFVFMFALVGYDQQALLRSVREATGGAPLCGCSGEGIIAQGLADETNSGVALMCIASDELRFTPLVATNLADNSLAAGEQIARAIGPRLDPDAIALFLFTDVTLNFDKLMKGLDDTLHSDSMLPVLGGLAADNFTSAGTYQYCNDTVLSDSAAAVLMSGRGTIAWGVNHGCVPIGNERKVTRSELNRIYEIDGKPATDILNEYIDQEDQQSRKKALINLCIGLKAPSFMKDYNEYLIRFIPVKNDEAGYIGISAEIPAGTSIWMTRRDHGLVAEGVDSISQQIKKRLGNRRPKLILQFDCAGRGKVLFRERHKLIVLEKLQRTLGRDVPWLGFYTYGEICPVGGRNCYHNYTAVVAAVY
jgi:hypothetical protein